MVSLLRRRAMMVQTAVPVVEPNVTITDFLGNGANSIELDIGMSNPSYLMLYAKSPLSSGTFWNNSGGYRLMQLADPDYARDLYASTTTSASYGGRLSSAASALLVYQNGVLSTGNSTAVFRSGYDYRLLAINPNGGQVKNLIITSITGNGQPSIEVDLGDMEPSILLLYPTAPMTSGSFPNNNNGQRLFLFYDHSVSATASLYANTRNNTSTGNYLYQSDPTVFKYEDGVITIGSSTVLRSSYAYKIIAIE